jgi:hypothetical protein
MKTLTLVLKIVFLCGWMILLSLLADKAILDLGLPLWCSLLCSGLIGWTIGPLQPLREHLTEQDKE